jgi:5-methylcytosine-specific restriction endonuclease McrA
VVSRFVDYWAVLASDGWAVRAKAAKRRAGFKCQVCNGVEGGLQAHHRTYERLGREDDADLTVLCAVCHELFSKHGRLAQYREDGVA